MRTKIICLVLGTLSACAPFRLNQRSAENGFADVPIESPCSKTYETPYLISGGFAAGFGFLAGASGVGTLGFKGNPDGSLSGGQIGLGLTSIAVGLGSAVSAFVSGVYASKYSACKNQLTLPSPSPSPSPSLHP